MNAVMLVSLVLLSVASIQASPLNLRITETLKSSEPKKPEKAGIHNAVSPTVSTKLTQKTVRKGERLQLECDAFGAPTPQIVWSFNGKRLPTNELFHQSPRDIEALLNSRLATIENTITKSILEVECFTEAHEGVYSCAAEAGPFTSNASYAAVLLEEETRNEIPLCLSELQRGPVLSMWSTSRLERENAYIQMMCRLSDGGMSDSVAPLWFKMGEEDTWNSIDSTSTDYVILDSGDLLIKPSVSCNPGGCFFACFRGGRRMESFVYETTLDNQPTRTKSAAAKAFGRA